MVHIRHRLASGEIGLSVDARSAGALADLNRLITSLVALVLSADLLSVGDAGVGDGSSVAIVGVDTEKAGGAAFSNDAIESDVTLEHLLAVTAGPVEFAEVADVEAGDGDSATTVVLDDLVGSALGTTT